MADLNAFVGCDTDGNAQLYVQVVNADGEHVRYLTGAELQEIADKIDDFDFSFDDEPEEDDDAGEN